MKFSINSIILSLLFFFISHITIAQESNNSIVLYRIDNQVLISVNDNVIYDSGEVEGDPELEITVDLGKFINNEDDVIKVILVNSPCKECLSNPWTISYELYQDGESMDYIFESDSGKGKGGEVFSMEYLWGDI